MSELTPEFMREALIYDPETGTLIWRVRPLHHFLDRRCQRMANTKFAGKSAGTPRGKGENSYLIFKINQQMVYTHRAAWAIHHGVWPTENIDHINGQKHDNRIANLRDVSKLVNSQNSKMFSTNKSGVTGVCWCKRDLRWKAYIKRKNVAVHLGNFVHMDDAIEARKAAQAALGFHPNHGRPVSIGVRASA